MQGSLIRIGLGYGLTAPRPLVLACVAILVKADPVKYPDGVSFAVEAGGGNGQNGLWLTRSAAEVLLQSPIGPTDIKSVLLAQMESV